MHLDFNFKRKLPFKISSVTPGSQDNFQKIINLKKNPTTKPQVMYIYKQENNFQLKSGL